jgi:hypothetical protein
VRGSTIFARARNVLLLIRKMPGYRVGVPEFLMEAASCLSAHLMAVVTIARGAGGYKAVKFIEGE